VSPQARRRHFHEELDTLQARLMEMAGLVERLIGQASESVLRRDASMVGRLIADDDRVDELEIEIDERVMELLALQQPMAVDLRQIVATNKASNDLERMGDHAVNIAKAARRLADAPAIPEVRELSEMVAVATDMVSRSLAAYVSRDPEAARRVCETDDRVDDLRGSMYRILVTHMLEDPRRLSAALELLLVSQNLERIADLATNIAEDVVFLVEGRNIKHGTGASPRRGGDAGS
jgi:phosphate transport system protein